jgi:ATP-dependent exoDNAse (exonuclease V) beta subunit
VIEEGTEGVRIMTVHKAKGLEFPVVILADPVNNPTASIPSRHVDAERGLFAERLCGAIPQDVLDHRDAEAAHEHAEAVRLAYVAATRARDLLVVPAAGEGEELTGWSQFLNPAIYPGSESRRTPERPERDGESVPGCPAFGDEAIVFRPATVHPVPTAPELICIKPGLHRSRAGTRIVWWDPCLLKLAVPSTGGLRAHEIFASDDGEVATRSGIDAHEQWRTQRASALEAGSVSRTRIATVRSIAARRPRVAEEPVPTVDPWSETVAEELVEVRHVASSLRERPAGVRFGELVHRVLASIDLDSDHSGIERMVQAVARIVGASPEERHAAAALVAATLRDPVLRLAQHAAAEGGLRREVPVFQQTDEGEFVEGVVDLAFRQTLPSARSVWTVVEFKTDREVRHALPRYQAQVALYVNGIRLATGDEARGILLVI